jgi:hypothetical protein
MEDKFILTIIGWVALILGWVTQYIWRKNKDERYRIFSTIMFVLALVMFIGNIIINLVNL